MTYGPRHYNDFMVLSNRNLYSQTAVMCAVVNSFWTVPRVAKTIKMCHQVSAKPQDLHASSLTSRRNDPTETPHADRSLKTTTSTRPREAITYSANMFRRATVHNSVLKSLVPVINESKPRPTLPPSSPIPQDLTNIHRQSQHTVLVPSIHATCSSHYWPSSDIKYMIFQTK